MKWGFTKQQGGAKPDVERSAGAAANDAQWAPPVAAEARAESPVHPSLELIGQQDERMRVRISTMLNRLDDLANFRTEFVALTESVGAFAAEYPQLRAKLLETERLHADERETNETMSRELRTL